MQPTTGQPPPTSDQPGATEQRVVRLVAAVQFVNVLDFVMVMPMGPDFAAALDIPMHSLGLVGGSYTAAAGISGLVGSLFLDRFDRRKALAVCMAGLVLGTACGALATGLYSLLAARVLAGVFGGPATSVALSMVSDLVPVQRRGRAMGTVMSAFSVASVLGIPAGLTLARVLGWRAPFLAVAALGAVFTVAVVWALPPMKGHLLAAASHKPGSMADLLRNRLVLLSYVLTVLVMMGAFVLIPNISAFVQFNLGYPRERLDILYAAGGVVSFVAMRVVGRLVDRYGSWRTGLASSVLFLGVVYGGFVAVFPWLPVMAVFILFMVCNSFRNVSYNALTSRVPQPQERARFTSLQSAVQHLAGAAAAVLSSRLLTEDAAHKLHGMDNVAFVTMAITAAVPVAMYLLERGVKQREHVSAAQAVPA